MFPRQKPMAAPAVFVYIYFFLAPGESFRPIAEFALAVPPKKSAFASCLYIYISIYKRNRPGLRPPLINHQYA